MAEDIKEMVEEIKAFCEDRKDTLDNMKDFCVALQVLLGWVTFYSLYNTKPHHSEVVNLGALKRQFFLSFPDRAEAN